MSAKNIITLSQTLESRVLSGGLLSENIEPRSPKPRIETLSDLIFGLALSVGAIALLSTPPSNLGQILGDIAGFSFSFLILISFWLRYTEIMSVLPVENRAIMILNVLMLLLVAMEPYLFNLVTLFSHSINNPALIDAASTMFSFDMAGLMAILGFFSNELAAEEKNLVPKEMMTRYKRMRNNHFAYALVFLFTALPQFWVYHVAGNPVRFYLWLLPLVFFWLSRRYWERSSSKVSRQTEL